MSSAAGASTVLNFEHIMDLPSSVLLSNGAIGLGIGPSLAPDRASAGDRFDEARVGLDHLSFQVDSLAELELAIVTLDTHGVRRGLPLP